MPRDTPIHTGAKEQNMSWHAPKKKYARRTGLATPSCFLDKSRLQADMPRSAIYSFLLIVRLVSIRLYLLCFTLGTAPSTSPDTPAVAYRYSRLCVQARRRYSPPTMRPLYSVGKEPEEARFRMSHPSPSGWCLQGNT